jgi:hypothetical protein
MENAELEMSHFHQDRRFFLQGVQAIGALGVVQLLIAFALPRVFPLDVLKVLIGVNQLLFVSLIAWYASQLRYDRRWAVAFGMFSLIPVLGFLPAALLYWKSEKVVHHSTNELSVLRTM